MIISQELITKVVSFQNIFWQNVSTAVTDATGKQFNFSEPMCEATPVSELYAAFGAPMMVVTFAFANTPDNTQAVLIDEATAAKWAGELLNEDHTGVDENTVSDLRPALEAIVQGLCLAIGQIKGEPVVASGMTIRHQMFSFPNNLQRAEQLACTIVKISAGAEIGTATWLLDRDAIRFLSGEESGNEESGPFPNAEDGRAYGNSSNVRMNEDMHGLELLLDVPLEISVELGRVKMLVKDVVELGTGSIVEIDKASGEPVDVMVNGKLVARGEVVVIEDNFGVRVTEILNPHERLRNLGDAA